MEELQQLREYMQAQDYAKAMDLIGEMEEMSKEDKLHKIHSYAVILMLHLIKQAAEQRTNWSWDFSIYNATKEIARINRRRKSGGHYASDDELQEIVVDALDTALKRAALEVLEGKFEEDELLQRISPDDIRNKTLKLILSGS